MIVHEERFLDAGIRCALLKTYVINKPKYPLGLRNHLTSPDDVKARANYTRNGREEG